MNTVKIGWAMRDISPKEPVNLPGQFHERITKDVMDSVTLTALVVDSAADLAIFLSADIIAIRHGLLDLIRSKVTEKNPDIPVMKILFSATHTHTGPGYYTVFHKEQPLEYKNFLAERAAEAICEAYDSRKAGGIAYGYGFAAVAHNRRSVYFDDVSKRPGASNNATHGVSGHAVMYGNSNDKNFSHFEGGADHFVNLMFTFDENNKLTGAIVNVPCPSQASEQRRELSADFWHDLRRMICEKFGNIFILPQCAAAGDLSPHIQHYKAAQLRRIKLKYGEDTAKDIGVRLDAAGFIFESFCDVLDWASKDIQTDFEVKHIIETVDLKRRFITDEEYSQAKENIVNLEKQIEEAKKSGNADKITSLDSGKRRYNDIISRYDNQNQDPTCPMELHVIKLGDIAFASNTFELYSDFQHRMQARSPFIQTFIVQLSGQSGEFGGTYLATERAVKGKGYGASMYCNQVSAEGGQQIVDETVRILKEIH